MNGDLDPEPHRSSWTLFFTLWMQEASLNFGYFIIFLIFFSLQSQLTKKSSLWPASRNRKSNEDRDFGR